ncbi:hypothetical protein SAMN05216420_101433 [Nitrosospira sp. Nl5]|uniref:hypothetical protein n=1 Tax=Nitrosospira sp. Nl5 TaxID=200120 RepID=UPI000889EC6E|nr:hypothetical protein [Nitrosospira sp. Nl5]SCX95255.1 hypothetical protein SAMN05216420_101433 [Nitrosospira sp. Nl5]
MKTKNIFGVLSVIGLLASPLATATENPEILSAAKNAVTRSDHEAVAKFYEDEARQIQAKVEEQKGLLEQYENKSYLYGRQAQDLQSHTVALLRKYEQIVNEDIKEAAAHRQMASRLGQSDHAASDSQQLVTVGASRSE